MPAQRGASSGGAETAPAAASTTALQPWAMPAAQAAERNQQLAAAVPLTPARRAVLLASLADAGVSTSRSAPESASSISSAAGGALRRRGGRAVDSGELSEEGSDDDDVDPDVFGNMKAALVWDCAGRRLCVSARQYVETRRKVEVKAKGLIDTAAGQHRVWGHVRRNFYTHVPLLQRLLTAQTQRNAGGWVDEPDLDPDAFLPGGLRCLLFQDWCIAPGLSYDTARSTLPLQQQQPASGSGGGAGQQAGGGGGPAPGQAGLASLVGQRVRYQLAIKKNPQVLRNSATADVWVAAKALAEFDAKASEVTLGGSLRLKAIRYGVTGGGQDLRLTAGLDLLHDDSGKLAKLPYFHVSDGKLGAKLQLRRWTVTYTL
ncbi:hypothetical protein HYH02_012445 [Chlamydomonas schloesseri]|uniref:Uncharacterized protein n=1 Tax=Chlamydomonas schloesseri TaxID=2026947 RepID=A0A835T192_9CHLO|nr:hypothetical protein HYH02_012445 [Chlamydomonas schloesseri]|eukprot:KAG2433983.1 hypothetical protein HYH02_012445 [Chlamydomonas schloesseri]